MHLFLRTLLHLFLSKRRSRLDFWGVSSVPMRVLPTDIDIAGHINNGMYFSLMDLGRFDLLVRCGFWKTMMQRGWRPVVNAETIAFRKSLNLWQKYRMESKILGFDERAIYLEHRMVCNGEIYARAVIASRLVSKLGPVSNEEIFEAAGQTPPPGMVLPDWIHQWREANALPSTRRPAPSAW